MEEKDNWDIVIKSNPKNFDLNLKEALRFKDLLFLFVRRDLVAVYKQTIFGPIWFFLQPLLNAVVFSIIFGQVAKLPNDGVPGILFYMSGIILWSFFSDGFLKVSDTFISNASVYGKVYFPRIISPLSVILSGSLKFLIQVVLFIVFYVFFVLYYKSDIQISSHLFFFPLIILNVALLSLSCGLIISSLTTRYRDLRLLINFVLQLLMYFSPVIFPLSKIGGIYKTIIMLNPMSSLIAMFKYSVFGKGLMPEWYWLMYSACFAAVAFIFAIALFNKTEKNFMDTI